MNNKDALKDLSILTAIPYSSLQKVSSKIGDIICHDIKESYYQGENNLEVDLGIGKLTMLLINDNISYGFVPSLQLERKIIDSFDSSGDVLIEKLEQSLKNKIINSYKELY